MYSYTFDHVKAFPLSVHLLTLTDLACYCWIQKINMQLFS